MEVNKRLECSVMQCIISLGVLVMCVLLWCIAVDWEGE